MKSSANPPPQWGGDELTRFLEQAYQNRFATFARKSADFQRLVDIDNCFMRISDKWLNPKSTLAPAFFFRAHSAFRGACEHATAGQVVETYPLIRSVLEIAGYALHIHRHPELASIWLNRHNDQASEKAVREQFKISKIRESIAATNREAARVFSLLYDRTIDFGGHPNERSVTSSMTMTELDDRTEIQHLYLHSDDLPMNLALKTVAQAGVCALEIFQDVFAARFELLGVRYDLLRLRKSL